ncbi:hypothetical protein V8G54_025932, partial [Vigna mungo]
DQNEETEKIVKEIKNNLRPKILNLPRDELVGIEDRVKDLGNILRFDLHNDVRVVGISGMGGIGKTTLARALYERICHQYDHRCYIDDVSKIFLDSRSLGLQKQLVSQTLNEKNVEICNVIDGTCLVQSQLNAKTIIVFDNVDEVQQLRIFSGNRDNLLRDCLGKGSRIIIVSRDEQLLKIHGVDDIYQVRPLNWGHAIQLFCRNAFKDNYSLRDYEKWALGILSHVEGHPLAIETIGSSLFGRSLSQWKSATGNLEAIVLTPHIEIPGLETIKADGLSKIKNLKLLDVGYVKFSGSLSHLSNELGYLNWYRYPFEYLPQSFQPHKLVQLILRGNNIQRLWEGTKPLPNLKRLDLSFCESLVEMPDVAEALNLEWISFEGCVQLQELNPSIGSMRKLVLLNLRYCRKLLILSNTILSLNYLKYLYVRGCSIIGRNCLLDETRNTEHLISCLSPSSPLSCLCELDLSFCNLVQIPDYIGKLRCLKSLNLQGNNFDRLPNLKDLLRLYFLNLQDCNQLKYLPDLPSKTVLPSEPFTSRFRSSMHNTNFTSVERTGLIIYGCPELVEIEECIRKSFSWTIQIIKATYQLFLSETYMPQSIMPGSQIPSLFNNEFVNGDIKYVDGDIEYLDEKYLIVDPPPVSHDNNLIGVLCCVIFRLYNNEQIPMDFEIDHMWLHYQKVSMDARGFRPCRFSLTQIIKLLGYFTCFSTVDVKKFQYRWVNERDLINLKMTSRKRKISVIEENG